MTAKLLLALASSAATWLLLELGFGLLHVASDGFGHTRSAQRWAERYWHPINAAGYRDVAHDPAVLASTRRVFVVGDSFAAGHGIEASRDRFPDRLRADLGERWSVVLIAQPGWNTPTQAKALAALPLQPHVLLLTYYLNDIEDAARDQGRVFDFDLRVRPDWLAGPVAASNVLDFAYWRIARSHIADAGLGYADFVYAAYRDPEVWAAHTAELDAIVVPAQRRGTLVHAVVFPHLFDLAGSAEPVAQVRDYLTAQGVDVLDVLALLREGDWPAERLVVAPLDPHPSVALHAAVAEAVLPRITR